MSDTINKDEYMKILTDTPCGKSEETQNESDSKGSKFLKTLGSIFNPIGSAITEARAKRAKAVICNSISTEINNTMSSFFSDTQKISNSLSLKYNDNQTIDGDIKCDSNLNVTINAGKIVGNNNTVLAGVTENLSCAVSFTNEMQTDNIIQNKIANDILDTIKSRVENDSSLKAATDIVSKILNKNEQDGEINKLIDTLGKMAGSGDPDQDITTAVSNAINNTTTFNNNINKDFESLLNTTINRDKKYRCLIDTISNNNINITTPEIVGNKNLFDGRVNIQQHLMSNCMMKINDSASIFSNISNQSTTDMSYDVINKSTLQAQTSVKSELDNIQKTTSIIGEFLHSISTIILVIGIIIAVCIVGFGGFMLIRQLKKKKQCDFYDEAGNLVQADCDYTNQGDINEAPFNNPKTDMKLSTKPSS